MRIALMADFHANLRALEACLDHAKAQKADRLVFLGDYVDRGPDSKWVVARLMALEQKRKCLCGNSNTRV